MSLTEPSAELIALMDSIKKAKRQMEKYGANPSVIRISPSAYCILANTKGHKQYDPEACYGRICGMDVYVDESIETETVRIE